MTIEEVRSLIVRHIERCERHVEQQQARIRETYDSGIHTNVDPQRAAIAACEQRKIAFEIVLDEIS